jgi:CBS domain-containing protein
MRIRELMSQPIVFARADESVLAAARRMRQADVGVLPVVHRGHLLGMLTDRDVLLRVTAEARDPRQTPVGAAMTPGVRTCFIDDDVSAAAAARADGGVRRLVVVDADGAGGSALSPTATPPGCSRRTTWPRPPAITRTRPRRAAGCAASAIASRRGASWGRASAAIATSSPSCSGCRAAACRWRRRWPARSTRRSTSSWCASWARR